MRTKNIEIYGIKYDVSDTGLVFGKTGEISQRLDEDGYPNVTVGSKYIKRTNARVHRLVALCFVENPYNKPEVNHIDGDKQNNNYKNLEWATRREQILHAFKLGLKSVKGSKNPRAVLSELDAQNIRILFEQGKSKAEIARLYGIGWTTVQHVINKDTWK